MSNVHFPPIADVRIPQGDLVELPRLRYRVGMSLLDKFLRRAERGGSDVEAEPQSPSVSRTPSPPPPRPAEERKPLHIQMPQPYKRFPPLPGSDLRALSVVGAQVRTRLDNTPGAVRVKALNVDMYRLPKLLSEEEREELIRLIDSDVKPSTLLTGGANAGMRTSQTCRLSGTNPLVRRIEERIAANLGLPLTHSETVQGQRYEAGQQFKMHNDYFAGGQPYSATLAREGGQRTWTAMVFLNEPDAGGCTHFPRAGVKVAPEPGTLLTWNNMDRQGQSNPFSHHEGMIIDRGVKYILTKWFREREWHSSAESDALRV